MNFNQLLAKNHISFLKFSIVVIGIEANFMYKHIKITNFTAIILFLSLHIGHSPTYAEDFFPSPTSETLANPHRGFVLWGSNVLADGGLPENHYGSNIYHVYLPWRMIESSDQVFEWQLIEDTYLQPILSSHPDATFLLRMIADYPNGGPGNDFHYTDGDINRDYPLFLEQPPLNIGRNDYAQCSQFGPGIAPDWNSPAFADQIVELIEAFATHFDGDHRVTAIQTGLLGFWGEWHQFNCKQFAPLDPIKNLVKSTYNTAFNTTPIQTRYAKDPDATSVEFGFYEDYFPSFTTNCIYDFPDCSDTGSWNLEFGFSNIVPDARNNWMSNPISGESPLSTQREAWVNDTEDIITVINDYHFSFLGPAGKHGEAGFDIPLNSIANNLGYRLQLDRVTIDNPIINGNTQIHIDLSNVGSAPVYFDYQLILEIVDAGDKVVDSITIDQNLNLIVPDETVSIKQFFNDFGQSNTGIFQLKALIKSMHSQGKNIILANLNRDAQERVMIGSLEFINDNDLIFTNGFD